MIDVPIGLYKGDDSCVHFRGIDSLYQRECCGGRKHTCLKIMCDLKGIIDPDIVSCQRNMCGDYRGETI